MNTGGQDRRPLLVDAVGKIVLETLWAILIQNERLEREFDSKSRPMIGLLRFSRMPLAFFITILTGKHKMAQNSMKILKASHRAAEWHASQRRKCAAQEPYVNHLIEVAALVAAAGAADDVICA